MITALRRLIWSQLDSRQSIRIPGIDLKLRALEFGNVLGAQPAAGFDIEPQVRRREGRNVAQGEREEAGCRAQTLSVFGVPRPLVLLLEVNKGARELDQPFIKSIISIARLQPEMLENVVRFIVFGAVEAGEPAGVTGVEPGFAARQAINHRLDSFAFFHRPPWRQNYPVGLCARQAAA